MTINECYEFLKLLSNKNQSGQFTPDRFNLAIQRANLDFYEKEYKMWQATQKITDALKPFLKTTSVSVSSQGRGIFPSDYRHISSCRKVFYHKDECGDLVGQERDIEFVNNGDLGNARGSQIITPTKDYPLLTMYSTYMQFTPKNIGAVTLDYLKVPLTPFWNYTTVNNRPVYNPTGSQSLEFPDNEQNNVVYLTAVYLGMNLSKADLFQAADKLSKENISA